jgi:hypothetical protein
MSTLAQYVLTLADWAKRLDPDGKVPTIVELLSQTNEILRDMLWMEGNLLTGHRTTMRTGLPTVAWRLLNQGVQPSKSTTAQVDFACAIMEAWSEVDKELADLGGNSAAFRLSEAQAFIEAMNQEMASTLFYGNASVSPSEFNGLSVQFSDKSAANGSNVIDAGSSDTDNTSIWLIGWGANSVHGIFPKGSKAGLTHEDLGEQTVQTSAAVGGTRLRCYQEKYNWKCGLAVRDWRYVVRIGSIDVSNLTGKSSAADLIELMIKAYHRLPSMAGVRPAFYMNRTVFQMLDIQRRDDVISGGGIRYENVDGMSTPVFRGIPIRKCDALLENEDAI